VLRIEFELKVKMFFCLTKYQAINIILCLTKHHTTKMYGGAEE